MKSFFFHKTVFFVIAAAALIFLASYFVPALYRLGFLVLLLLLIAVLVDALFLYGKRNGIDARRSVSDRLSIGDDNVVRLEVKNDYNFPVPVAVIDEIPVQFQDRNWIRRITLLAGEMKLIDYTLRPLSRGEYIFNDINVFVTGPLSLARRKYTFTASKTTKVYPSFITMRRFQLLAVANKLQEAGVKKNRRLGHSMEFEQIKEYVRGDDYRTINWKATARKDSFMVNNYVDERSQQVYCIINRGRVMKMPFDGLTLLDHAINASLVLSNVAMIKQDRAGLITFAETLDSFVAADRKPGQMGLIQETLYRQQTRFLEADYEKLYSTVRNKITNRSLLVLFTNFESIEGLRRELPALRKIAHHHLLLVVFFENTALLDITNKQPRTLEDIYIKTIAEKFNYEKRLMVKELHMNGIGSILSKPQNLTVNAINRYLEIKTRTSI